MTRTFKTLWAGQAISQLGSQVSLLAFPLVSAVWLSATPFQMGTIMFLELLPGPLFTIPSGVVVELLSRRKAMLIAHIGRFLVLSAIPILYLMGALSIEWMLAVAFLNGCLTVLFHTAYQSILPTLVDRGDLVAANSRLEMTRATAQIVGPGLATVLVGTFGPALAILADALSFVAAGLSVSLLPPEKSQIAWKSTGTAILVRRIVDGMAVVYQSNVLLAFAVTAGVFNFFATAALSQYVLYVTRVLEYPYHVVSAMMVAGAVGAFAGAFFADRCIRGLGFGAALMVSAVVGNSFMFLLPAADSSHWVGPVFLVIGFGGFSAGSQIYNVAQLSLRQKIVPDDLITRVTAVIRFVASATAPLGALLGGWFASAYGSRELLLACALGLMLAPLYLFASRFMRGLAAYAVDREGEQT